MEAGTGDVLAMVSAPSTSPPALRAAAPTPDELLDRARYGQYPPGSTFKLVTAMAALRADRFADASHVPVPSAGRRALREYDRGMESRDQGRYRRSRARHARYGARDRGFLQCVLRAAWRARRGFEGAGGDGGHGWGFRRAIRRSCARRCRSRHTGRVRCWSRRSRWRAWRRRSRRADGCRRAAGLRAMAIRARTLHWRCLPSAQAAFLAGAMRRVVTEGTARHVMAGTDGGDCGKDRHRATRPGTAARMVHGICAGAGNAGAAAGLCSDCGDTAGTAAASRRRSRAK